MAEVAAGITKYGLSVVALQEIRWKGQGELRKRAYSMYYSGGERPGHQGTGFYVEKKIRKSVLLFEPINDRICRLRLRGRFQNISMVAVYAPTEDRDEEDKDKVYDDLVGACSRISRHDLILILKITMPRSGKNPLLTEAFTT
ncbi:Craniofacial development protein 2 [Formica fusca]